MNASSYSVWIYLLIFRSDDSKCLDDPPTKREVISTQAFDIPGRLYDADQQCQLAYGQDSKYCHGDKFLDVSSDYEFTCVTWFFSKLSEKLNYWGSWTKNICCSHQILTISHLHQGVTWPYPFKRPPAVVLKCDRNETCILIFFNHYQSIQKTWCTCWWPIYFKLNMAHFRKRNIEAKNNAYCFWLTTNQEDRNIVKSELH